MDFGWPNVEISQKMANSQLLFLALLVLPSMSIMITALHNGVVTNAVNGHIVYNRACILHLYFVCPKFII